jgi:hypothetical protein
MAATELAARLTEVHRLAQARLGAQTVIDMRAVFVLLDPAALDATTARWVNTALRIVAANRTMSARLAANYLRTFKALELGATARPVPFEIADELPVEAVTTSLTVTGPVTVKASVGRGATLQRALELANASSSASAMRHVLNGGRETVTATTAADRQASGWARVTSGRPCAFCAMIASRGAVYGRDSVEFHAHDHCSCGAEPRYRDDAALPPGSERYAELWQQAKDAAGHTAVEFRRLVEG